MIVPHDLINVVETTRLISDGHSPLIEQAALATFIEEGHFTRHVRRMRKLYAERQAAFLDLASRYLGDRVEIKAATSGMHLIGWLPKGVSDTDVSEAAATVGVRIAPLSEYAIKKQERGGLLFGYAGFSVAEMETAIKRLSQIKFR
jgi:GntR family transcriptional regulator/MocR family aminotransferase